MVSSRFLSLLVSCSYLAVSFATTLPIARHNTPQHKKDATVLILGGGVSGIIAAQTLKERGITDFKIIEARNELGGRLHSERFGAPDRQVTVEVRGTITPPNSSVGIDASPPFVGWCELGSGNWRWSR